MTELNPEIKKVALEYGINPDLAYTYCFLLTYLTDYSILEYMTIKHDLFRRLFSDIKNGRAVSKYPLFENKDLYNEFKTELKKVLTPNGDPNNPQEYLVLDFGGDTDKLFYTYMYNSKDTIQSLISKIVAYYETTPKALKLSNYLKNL